ncbi:hypothetical protein BZL39_L00580 [Zygosaccharomyces parabailii]|nr:hypothetical protein BZL39_L00580 [Zygosaccharomyces parabailii]CDH09206.1 related to Putative aryl-alcohol dehydrogenase YPL088W [Zygosaccharomyces bailii ISA1307]
MSGKQVPFGNTELMISPIIVGCPSFSNRQDTYLNYIDKNVPLLQYCYDNGLRTFNTRDHNELLLSSFLRQGKIDRSTVTIICKLNLPKRYTLNMMTANGSASAPKKPGFWCRHVLKSVSESIQDLQTHIDVLVVPRILPEVSSQEVMDALNQLVVKGRVGHLCASQMPLEEFSELQCIAGRHQWTKFAAFQSLYNLIYREDEPGMISYAREHGLALLSSVPLANGILAKPAANRGEHLGSETVLDYLYGKNQAAVSHLQELAEKEQCPMASVAAAWVMSKGLTPTIGVATRSDVEDALHALEISLSSRDIAFLERDYYPSRVWDQELNEYT